MLVGGRYLLVEQVGRGGMGRARTGRPSPEQTPAAYRWRGGRRLVSLGVYLATSSPGSGQPGASGSSSTTVQGSQAAGGGQSNAPTLAAAGPPVCAKGSLTLVGSTAFMPIATLAAEACEHACQGATIDVTGGDSAYGLGHVQGALASSPSSAGSMIAMYDGSPSASAAAGLMQYPVGILIYSVVAHSGLFPSLNVTPDQLASIFVSPGVQGKVAVGRSDFIACADAANIPGSGC